MAHPTPVDRSHRWPRDLLAVVAGIGAVGLLGGVATDIGPWYFSLKQPAWKPPDAAFGPAWMLIYLCTGRALLVAWRAASDAARRALLGAAVLNAAVNVGWSVLFFTLKRPDWALIGSALLMLSIGHLMWTCRRGHSKERPEAAPWPTSSRGLRSWLGRPVLLLVPYALWVSCATAINAGVVALNGPFGRG